VANAYTSIEYLAQEQTGETFSADLSLRFGPQDERWRLTGRVRNVTDADILALSQYNGTTGSVIVNSYAPPRTYGFTASARF
jgi:outer membrane receptor protein involved in Fe transport